MDPLPIPDNAHGFPLLEAPIDVRPGALAYIGQKVPGSAGSAASATLDTNLDGALDGQ
jgi:hypothetical protein